MNQKQDETYADLLAELHAALKQGKWRLAVAESLTGGMLGSMLSAAQGASSTFLGGVIAYDERIKQELLGVKAEVLAERSAVSAVCAIQMADGVRALFDADIAISLTGLAGPSGLEGFPEIPVGRVYLGLSWRLGLGLRASIGTGSSVKQLNFPKRTRDDVRALSCEAALKTLAEIVAHD